MTNVYAKIDGKLAHWEVDETDHAKAIQAVRESLPQGFVETILARIK
jgi:hypothetical protein